MRLRNIFLLIIMLVLLILFFYCLIRKTNHTTFGYITAILSFLLLMCTGVLLFLPKLSSVPQTGPYKVTTANTWYTDNDRIETYGLCEKSHKPNYAPKSTRHTLTVISCCNQGVC